jgi:hypothetical protein
MSFSIKGLTREDTWMATPTIMPIFRNPDPNSRNYINLYQSSFCKICRS